MENRLPILMRLGAYGIACSKGKILLVVQNEGPLQGKWDFPGGGIEPGETIEEALRREFLEEVGMTFKEMNLLTNLSSLTEISDDSHLEPYTFHRVGMIYEVMGAQTVLPHTSSLQYNWVPWEELNQENSSPFVWEIICGMKRDSTKRVIQTLSLVD